MRNVFAAAVLFASVGAGFILWQVAHVWRYADVGREARLSADDRQETGRASKVASGQGEEVADSGEGVERSVHRPDVTETGGAEAGGVGGPQEASSIGVGNSLGDSVGVQSAASRPVRWADDVRAKEAQGPVSDAGKSESSLRQAAQRCEEREDWEGAADAYERLIGAYSGRLTDRAALAGVLMRLRRWVQALPHCLVIVESSPGDARAWHNLALCHQALGHLADARDAWGRVIELMPGNAEAYARQGETFADLGQWEQAAANFRTALVLSPADVGTALNLALAFEKMKRRADARDVLQRFLEGFPKAVPVLNRLAELSWKEYQAAPEFNATARGVAAEYWRRSLEIDRAQEVVAQSLREAGG